MIKKIVVFAIIGLILVVVWLQLINVQDMLAYFQDINVYYLFLTILFVLLAISFRALRWHLIVRRLIPKLKLKDSTQFYFLGAFVDFLIPIRVGELIKSYKVKKTYHEPISKTVSTIYIDRLMDAFPIIFIILLLPFINYKFSNVISILIIIIAVVLFLGGFVLLLFIVYPKIVSKLIVKLFKKTRFANKIAYFVTNFFRSFKEINFDFKLFSKISSLSLLAILSNCFAFWFVLKSFGDKSIIMPIAFFGYALLFLSYIIPAPPALIGSNELISVLIFSGIFGFSKEFISAVTVFFHSIMVIVMLAIGISLVKHYHIHLKEFLQKKGDKNIS